MSDNTAELKTEMDDAQTAADEIETLEDDPGQATILSFNSVAISDDEGDTREGVHVTVENEDTADTNDSATGKPGIEQLAGMEGTHPIHERAMEECEELGIDTRVIEFSDLLTVQSDKEGNAYVTDLRELVRYYLDDDADRHIAVTEDYKEAAFIAEESTQRKNDLEQMMGAH